MKKATVISFVELPIWQKTAFPVVAKIKANIVLICPFRSEPKNKKPIFESMNKNSPNQIP